MLSRLRQLEVGSFFFTAGKASLVEILSRRISHVILHTTHKRIVFDCDPDIYAVYV